MAGGASVRLISLPSTPNSCATGPIGCSFALVQVARSDSRRAAAIDKPRSRHRPHAVDRVALAEPKLVKVFHAARQDVEIFFHLTGKIPGTLVDTQVAAMVCGFGDSVSYETLAGKLTGARIDKSSRFTDWAQRPLTDRQLLYALSDVTHLRPAYEHLKRRLDKTGRGGWVAEEMAVLTSPATYDLDPRESWRRIKFRSDKPRAFAILREVAAWREEEARRRDLPRGRIVKDETLAEIAGHGPTDVEHLSGCRGFSRSQAESKQGAAILAAVGRALALPIEECPVPPPPARPAGGAGGRSPISCACSWKMRCEDHEVAQKLVASADDLELIAADDEADVPAMSGWRREIFGADALASEARAARAHLQWPTGKSGAPSTG